MTWVVTEVTQSTLRRDLLQRGAAVSRVVALSAGHSLLSNDPLGLDRLVSETRASDPDIAFVSIRDASDIVVAHDRVTERGKPYRPVPPLLPLGTFGDTRADEVVRDGRRLIEYTTPISFAGRHVGIASLGLSMEGLATAQRSIRRSIFAAAAVILVAAFFGTLLLSSFITTPVKRLHQGVLSLAGSETFQPVPARSSDELGALTRNFNRMAETILAQKTALQKEGAPAGGSVRQHGPRHRRVAGREGPVHDGALHPRGADVVRAGAPPRDGRGGAFRPGAGGDLPRPREDPDPRRRPPQGGALSRAEEEQMKSHPVDGTEILRMAPFLHRYIPVVRAHHEWYNGEGYPDGIKGDEIPLHAQLIALADAFDAMTTDRPYRQALSTEEAIDEILQFRGTQFSPELADAFAKMVREMPPMDETILKSMAL